MLATIIFFVAFFTLWWTFRYVFKPRLKIANAIDKLPGAYAYPLIGNCYLAFGVKYEDMFQIGIDYLEKYGPLCRAWIGMLPLVIISKPEHVEIILKSSTNITKSSVYNTLLPWLGDGILISTGNKWYHRRKLLTPAFHFQILQDYTQIFIEKSKTLIDILEIFSNGEVFDIYPIMENCMLDIISETAMNVKINVMKSKKSTYADAVSKLCKHAMNVQIKPWLRLFTSPIFPYGREIKKNIFIAQDLTKSVIKERKKTLFSNIRQIEEHFGKKRRLSLLDILLQGPDDDIGLSDSEIREEVDTFMFAGHHTTSTSICWTLFLLGNHQDIQENVYEEIKSVLQNKKVPSNIDELNELKYLECVIKESLRLYPSVPAILRKLSEDIYLDGFKIPKDCEIYIPIYCLHRNPECWDDPNVFDPTRFYPANSTERHPYTYIPFSAGKRNCIGQRFAMYAEKAVLASILKNYKIKSTTDVKDVKLVFELVLKSSNGIKITLQRRN